MRGKFSLDGKAKTNLLHQAKNDGIERLITHVGPRIKPDQETRDEVFQEVHKLWLQTHKKSFFQNHAFKIAASFLIFASLFTFTYLNKGDQPNYNIAKNLKLQGQIQISDDNINWENLSIHKTINPGDFIKTLENNRLYVKLTNGNSFRLDEKSTLKINTSDSFTLFNGQIYIDSDTQTGNHKLTVDTPLAIINHIGTRYSISYNDNSLNVSVRDGLVLVDRINAEKHEIEKGNQYTQLSNGEIKLSTIDTFDEKWLWTQKITQTFDIQDKSMSEYLEWVSNETGFPIHYESFNIKSKAKEVILSGSINGILPMDSIDVIVPTTRFSYEIINDEIYISYANS